MTDPTKEGRAESIEAADPPVEVTPSVLLPPVENEPLLCPVFCGAERHDEPKIVRFGMTCPGHDGTAVEINGFQLELAWRKEVAAAYGETLASSEEYTEALARRRQEADERVRAGQKWLEENPDHPEENPLRAKVTHNELVAHANEITPQVVARVAANANLKPVEFEPAARPLRVPLKDLSRRGSRIEIPRSKTGSVLKEGGQFAGESSPTPQEVRDAAQVADSAMFLDPTAE
jgi:hypothetical protein